MFAEAPDIDRNEILSALKASWGISARELAYAPVGFGSHHYVAHDDRDVPWFVTVDDLYAKSDIAADPDAAFVGLERAFESAASLRDAGLEFVHAPTVRRDGGLLARFGEHYSVAVFQFVDGRPGRFDDKLDVDQRRGLLGALGRLHGSTIGDPPRRDSLAIPKRGALLRSMDALHQRWTGGPFSEEVRELLAHGIDGVRDRLKRYDELAAAVLADPRPWVVTHGEPHPGNLIWIDSAFLLIDWDTVAVGPPERDLWMVDVADDIDAYVDAGGVADIDPKVVELYASWWSLCEVAGYVDTLRNEHRDDANTRQALAGLREYLPSGEE